MEDLLYSQMFQSGLFDPTKTTITMFPMRGTPLSTFYCVRDRFSQLYSRPVRKEPYFFRFNVSWLSLRQVYELAVLKRLFAARRAAPPVTYCAIPILSTAMTLYSLYQRVKKQGKLKCGVAGDIFSVNRMGTIVKADEIFTFPPENNIVYYTAEDAFLMQFCGVGQPDFLLGVASFNANSIQDAILENQAAFNILLPEAAESIGAHDLTQNCAFYIVYENGYEFDVNIFDRGFVANCQKKGAYFTSQSVMDQITAVLISQADKTKSGLLQNKVMLRIIENKALYGKQIVQKDVFLLGQDMYAQINRFILRNGTWTASMFGTHTFAPAEQSLVTPAQNDSIHIQHPIQLAATDLYYRVLVLHAVAMLKVGYFEMCRRLLRYATAECESAAEKAIIKFLSLNCDVTLNLVKNNEVPQQYADIDADILALIKAGYPLFAMLYLLYLLQLSTSFKHLGRFTAHLIRKFIMAASFVGEGISQIQLKTQFCQLFPTVKISGFYRIQALSSMVTSFADYTHQHWCFLQHLEKKNYDPIKFSRMIFEAMTPQERQIFQKLGCLDFFNTSLSTIFGLYMPFISIYNTAPGCMIHFVNTQLANFRLFFGMKIICKVRYEHIQSLDGITCQQQFTFFKRQFSQMFISNVQESELECLLSGQKTTLTISLPSLYLTHQDLIDIKVERVVFEKGDFYILSVEYDLDRFVLKIEGVYTSSILEDQVKEIHLSFNDCMIKSKVSDCRFYSRFKYANLQVNQVKCMSMNYFCNLYRISDFPRSYQQSQNFIVLDIKFNRYQISFISVQNIELGYLKSESGAYEYIRYDTNVAENCLLLFSQDQIQHGRISFTYGFDKLGKVDVQVLNLTQQIYYIVMGQLFHIYYGDMALYSGARQIVNAGKRIVMRRNPRVIYHAIFRPTGEYFDSLQLEDLEQNFWIDQLSEMRIEKTADDGTVTLLVPEIAREMLAVVSTVCYNCQVIEQNDLRIVFYLFGVPYSIELDFAIESIALRKQVVIQTQ